MGKVAAALLALCLAPVSVLSQDRGLSVIAREVTGSPDFNVGRQYAVIIGIDKYQEWPSLKSAVNEAKQVRAVLAERYFIDEFIELYDQAATAGGIRRLFAEDLPKKVGINDSLLVFYAGHGYLDNSQTGFWIASDGARDVYEQRGWIPNAQLRNLIGQLKAQRVLVVADACFSGDFLNVSRGALPAVDNAYFKRALQLTARQILTSGASETVPDESEFGRQLVNLLARNGEPFLDPIAMYDRIRRGVSRTQPLLGTIPGHEQGASFVLFLRPAAQASAPPPPAAPIRLVPENRGLVKVRQSEAVKGKCVVTLKPAAAEKAQPMPAKDENVLELGAWVLEAKLRDDLEPTFRKELAVVDGAIFTVEIPALGYSKPWQKRGLQSELDALSTKLATAERAQKTKTAIGWIALGLGAVGLGGAVYSYLDGVAAHSAYSKASLSSDASDAWSRVSLDATLFAASAAVGGVSLGVAPLMFFTSPVPGIKRQMEGITVKIDLLSR